jgi:hypothetical protein
LRQSGSEIIGLSVMMLTLKALGAMKPCSRRALGLSNFQRPILKQTFSLDFGLVIEHRPRRIDAPE